MTDHVESTALLVVFKAFLDTDHITEATGKTIAITISKNGGAFGNPAAGALNATEMAHGYYKASLGTADTNTVGPLAVRGTHADIDDVGKIYNIVPGINGVPDVNALYVGDEDAADVGEMAVENRLEMDANSTMLAAILGFVDDIGGAGAGLTAITSRLPAALVGGKMDASVGALGTDSITGAVISSDAIIEIQNGLATASAVSNISSRIPSGLIGGRMDSDVGAMGPNVLTAAAIHTDAGAEIAAAIWAATIESGLTAAHAMQALMIVANKKSGMGGTNPVARNFSDSKNRATFTTDPNGNVTAVTFSFD